MKDKILEIIRKEGYAILKGGVSQRQYERCRKEAIDFFNKNVSNDNCKKPALRGGIIPGIRDVHGKSSNQNWDIFRATHFHWNKIPSELRFNCELSIQLNKLRNKLNGDEEDKGLAIDDDGYMTYMSLSLYESEKGFLQKHRDKYKSKKQKDTLIHMKVELTHSGKDYDSGGYYIINERGKINLSERLEPGDIIAFDGFREHGIDKIQGGELGRIALFEIPTFAKRLKEEFLYTGDGTQGHNKRHNYVYNGVNELSERLNRLPD